MEVQFDKNMAVESTLDLPDVKFYDIDDEPIRLYGVWREGESYRRLPQSVADTVSEGIARRCTTTAGGRIRFVTDSPYVAIKVEYGRCELSGKIANTAMAGFDMYADGLYVGQFILKSTFRGEDFESVVKIRGERKPRLININMPLYSEVKRVRIGIANDAEISHAPDYKHETPVIFYGSSITHGAGASRPGSTYVARLSRKLDTNFWCLGFGGLAKGEVEIAKYIAEQKMSMFIYDYDHNAPTVAHLAETHERMFRIIREKNPTLPILMISRPNVCPDSEARFEVIKRTYDNARARGDENVYILKGTDFFGEEGLDFTTDGTHPSDLGYYFMTERIYPTIRKNIEKFH